MPKKNAFDSLLGDCYFFVDPHFETNISHVNRKYDKKITPEWLATTSHIKSLFSLRIEFGKHCARNFYVEEVFQSSTGYFSNKNLLDIIFKTINEKPTKEERKNIDKKFKKLNSNMTRRSLLKCPQFRGLIFVKMSDNIPIFEAIFTSI